jgi:uncharacterized membrane protein YphA (DoxX/SURF4 family)
METTTSTTVESKGQKTRNIIGIIACVIVGITLVMSGSGKLFSFGAVPGQTVEFIGYVMPHAWLTPFTVTAIYDVIIPYIVPAVELALGLLLLIGFAPRLMAVIFVPLTLMFMGNNIYSIHIGLGKYPDCSCFGIWETIFHTTLTPSQSLVYDIVLLVLALVIIFVTPLKFLQSQKWLKNLGTKKATPIEKKDS